MTTRQRSAKPVGKTAGERQRLPAELSQLNLNAAGIDVGATSHYVAVPADRSEQPVREFEAFTADLYRLAEWLAECGVETVVMESTGVSWIPPVRRAGRTGLPGDAGRPAAHQERVRPQDRRAGLPVAAAAAQPNSAAPRLRLSPGATCSAGTMAAAASPWSAPRPTPKPRAPWWPSPPPP